MSRCTRRNEWVVIAWSSGRPSSELRLPADEALTDPAAPAGVVRNPEPLLRGRVGNDLRAGREREQYGETHPGPFADVHAARRFETQRQRERALAGSRRALLRWRELSAGRRRGTLHLVREIERSAVVLFVELRARLLHEPPQLGNPFG